VLHLPSPLLLLLLAVLTLPSAPTDESRDDSIFVARVARMGSQRRSLMVVSRGWSLERFIDEALARTGAGTWDESSRRCVAASDITGVVYSTLAEVMLELSIFQILILPMTQP